MQLSRVDSSAEARSGPAQKETELLRAVGIPGGTAYQLALDGFVQHSGTRRVARPHGAHSAPNGYGPEARTNMDTFNDKMSKGHVHVILRYCMPKGHVQILHAKRPRYNFRYCMPKGHDQLLHAKRP